MRTLWLSVVVSGDLVPSVVAGISHIPRRRFVLALCFSQPTTLGTKITATTTDNHSVLILSSRSSKTLASSIFGNSTLFSLVASDRSNRSPARRGGKPGEVPRLGYGCRQPKQPIALLDNLDVIDSSPFRPIGRIWYFCSQRWQIHSLSLNVVPTIGFGLSHLTHFHAALFPRPHGLSHHRVPLPDFRRSLLLLGHLLFGHCVSSLRCGLNNRLRHSTGQ